MGVVWIYGGKPKMEIFLHMVTSESNLMPDVTHILHVKDADEGWGVTSETITEPTACDAKHREDSH